MLQEQAKQVNQQKWTGVFNQQLSRIKVAFYFHIAVFSFSCSHVSNAQIIFLCHKLFEVFFNFLELNCPNPKVGLSHHLVFDNI